MRHSEAQRQLLMEQTIGGILLSDPQGYYVEANSRMCAMLGYEKEQLLGLRLEDLTPPELTARLGELRSPLHQRIHPFAGGG